MRIRPGVSVGAREISKRSCSSCSSFVLSRIVFLRLSGATRLSMIFPETSLSLVFFVSSDVLAEFPALSRIRGTIPWSQPLSCWSTCSRWSAWRPTNLDQRGFHWWWPYATSSWRTALKFQHWLINAISRKLFMFSGIIGFWLRILVSHVFPKHFWNMTRSLPGN